ncbi:MAG: DUF502 domain-containing protein [Deltaproteobacteria bacterium]|nr:DUF502 domain-containing protein [Deltaproteobacteria bacterium]
MNKSIKGYFITGLLIVIPLVITVYVLRIIVTFAESLTAFIPAPLRIDTYLPVAIPGMGVVLTVILVFVVGVLGTNLFGKKLVELGERLLDKIPLIRVVYKGTKQFMETFFLGEESGFSKVVMVEYPRRGMYSIAFVTSRARGEIQAKTKETTINLFLPTTPNPTSGVYLVAPENDVVYLDMSVEDAFKIIVTGGLVVPPYKEGAEINMPKRDT